MAVAATRLFLALFLLSILIATVNLTDGGKTDEQTVTGGVENLSVKWVDNKKEGKMDVTLEMGKPVTSKHEKPGKYLIGPNRPSVYLSKKNKKKAV
jgi:hypothetical protein